MVIVALVGYHEQRGKRNWMRSSSNPRRKGRWENGDFHISTFCPFLALSRAKSRFSSFQRLEQRVFAGMA